MKLGSVMDLATRDVKTIPPRSTVMNALRTMVKEGFRRIPVADAGTKKLMGIVSSIDIIDFLGGGEKHGIVLNRYEGNPFKGYKRERRRDYDKRCCMRRLHRFLAGCHRSYV